MQPGIGDPSSSQYIAAEECIPHAATSRLMLKTHPQINGLLVAA